ncbi:MAG: protease modulator HflK, partial [Hyphomicrobiales bacterium]
ALRFEQVYAEYAKAPDVTRQRMYLETMERVLGGMDKIIIDEKSSGSGVVPFLPLNELQNRSNNQSATQGTGQ